MECRLPAALSLSHFMLILGVSSFKHDTATALFDGGILKAAIEEDKLTRSRGTGSLRMRFAFAWRAREQPGVIWMP